MITESIEGSSNIFGLENFCDPNKIKKAKYDSLEEYEIIANPTVYIADMREILKKFDEIVGVVAEFPARPKSPQPQPPPAQRTQDEIIADNYLSKISKPKQMPPSYEVSTANQYNTMLYGDSLDFDTQKQNLEKMQTLEAIQCLREELSKSRIPIEDVPLVSSSSAYPDVRSVYNILRYKKNLHLNHDIARDIVLFGVNQLTYFFDGSKTAWGRMPNLKGWERTAKMKLNSLKVELSTVVAETFNYYNIGPVGQILFSLVPSALIHMSTRYEQNPDLKINTEESLQNLYELGDPKN